MNKIYGFLELKNGTNMSNQKSSCASDVFFVKIGMLAGFIRMLEDFFDEISPLEKDKHTLDEGVFAHLTGRLGGNLCFFGESRHTRRHVEDMCLRSFSYFLHEHLKI